MEIIYLFAGLTILGLLGYGFQIYSVRATLKTKTSNVANHNLLENGSDLPKISILKPLKDMDDNLFDNLSSFCNLDYPDYEIIFSLQDYNDLAWKVARKVKDKHPHVDISIIVEKCDAGLNPKVNNLITAYKVSKYPYILISDSNVMVDRNYLKELVKNMTNDVGLVSNIIKGVGGCTIGSKLENLHLNSFIIGSVCFLDRFLKMPCVIGKSMLMRKEDLEAIGGFKAVKDVLAEDYIIGERINKLGKKVIISPYAINNVNEYWGMKRFLNRHTRWGKIRWKLGGFKYISELIGNPVFMSFIPLVLFEISTITLVFALIVSLIKIIGDLYLGKTIDPDSNTLTYLLTPIKDLIIGLVWFVPIFSNTVVWRGNRYFIGKDSMLSPYPEIGIWSWRYKVVNAIKTKIA